MIYHCFQIAEWTEDGRSVSFHVVDPDASSIRGADGNITVRGAGVNNDILKTYDVGEDYDSLPILDGAPPA